jgi:hypothetical protein
MLGSQDARLVRMCSLRVTKILGREKLCVAGGSYSTGNGKNRTRMHIKTNRSM